MSALRGSNPSLVMMLAALAAIGPFSIDTYLPAFPEIAQALATDRNGVQETISLYMLTFGIMALWHGALSDSFGRKRVILWSLAAYALTSIGCAVTTSIEMLWLMRALQGLCAGAGMIISRAMVRDLYEEGPGAQRLIANVAVMFAIAPAIAPMVGGWILYFLGWRAIFFFLAGMSALLLLVCWRYLPESLPPEKRQPFALKPLFRGYRAVFAHARFFLLSLGGGVFFGGFFIYILSAPVFIRDHLRLTETDFYWLFLPAMIGMVGGSWLSGRLAGRWSDRRTLRLAFVSMGGASILNLAVSTLTPDVLILAVLPFFFYHMGIALAMPNVTLLSLDMFPQNRGMAASCQGFIQTTFSTFLASFIVPILWGSRLELASGMLFFCSLGAIFVFVSLRGYAPAKRGG